ncbi:Trm112 family protein [Thermocrinis sp.]|uniref:Trm112 family protein n=1 Tax=Thermocrinis sp. TaxID=2024383 RepID=UPI003BFEB6B9
MSISKELLEILACPLCKGDLKWEENLYVLICEKCEVFYQVVDDIPILLPDSAKPLSELGKVPPPSEQP